jgi:cytochrome P450
MIESAAKTIVHSPFWSAMGSTVGPDSAAPAPLEYDPNLAFFRANRHAAYARLRAEAPAFWSERMRGWVITRYDDVVAILLDTEQFSAVNSIGIEPFDSFLPEVRAVLDQGFPRFPGIIEMDPPAHTMYRGLVNLAFTPRRVAALEPRIREIANELIDGFEARGRADFVKVFGDPLPIRVIGEILGVPVEDMDEVQRLSDSFRTLEAGTISALPVEEQIETARLFVAFQRYVAEMIDAHRASPRDDLISVIADTRLGDERPLSQDELVSTVIHLLFAGQETTTRLLASTVYFLLHDRSLWQELVEHPDLAQNAIEEGLRIDPPVTYHLRQARVAVQIDGSEIKSGDAVHLVFASANHDEAVFPNPERFDLHRPNASRHLGFGRGPHFCVGAAVGRLEGRIGLEILSQRVPSLRIRPGYTLDLEPHVMLSGIARLPVEWTPAA